VNTLPHGSHYHFTASGSIEVCEDSPPS
jgi:hypothetical protein